jgi:Fe2+ or Zn2+ uptake regulation protein
MKSAVRTSRNTRQREIVYELVASTPIHPTADWIYARARRRLPRISMGTIYRNLQVLERAGKIRSIESSSRATRYDADLSAHDHFLCEQCGGIFDIERRGDIEPGAARRLRGKGFEVAGHRLELHGSCPACSRHPAAKQRASRESI